jgi:TPR repeat protein
MRSVSMLASWAQVALGRIDEALATAQEEEASGYRDAARALAHWARGEHDAADRALSELVARGDIWSAQIAFLYATRDDADTAFEWLERAMELGDPGVPFANVQPLLRRLRGDARWPALLAKLGLTD